MIMYIKCFSKNKDFVSIFRKILNEKKSITNKAYETYQFQIDDSNTISIRWNKHFKLLRTIKHIDDLLDKELRQNKICFNIVVSNNLILGNYNHEGVLFKDLTVWKLIKDSSLIKDYQIKQNGVLFSFDFYTSIEYSGATVLKTQLGDLDIFVARIKSHNKEFTIVSKNLDIAKRINVRIHYQCETSEIFSSIHCDCREQLNSFLSLMHNVGNSLLIYAHEEGRGFGLFNKINAYKLTNETGLDTYNAMIKIARKSENRLFEVPADILLQLNIKKIFLWTNNPLKIEPVKSRGIDVEDKRIWTENLSIEATKYIDQKKQLMGHIEKNNILKEHITSKKS